MQIRSIFRIFDGGGAQPLGSPFGRAVTAGDGEGLAPLLPLSVLASLVHLSQRERRGDIINGQKCGLSSKIGAFRGNGKAVFVVRRDEGKADGADGVFRGAAVDIEDDGGAVDGIRVAAAEGVAHVAKVGKADIVIAVFKIEQGLSGAHVLNGGSIGGHFQTKGKADVRDYAVLSADLHCLSSGGGDQFLFTADGHCRFTVHHVRTGERGEQEIPPEFVVQGSVVRPVRQEITHLFQKSLAGFAQGKGIRFCTCRRGLR